MSDEKTYFWSITPTQLKIKGGAWLGAARTWIQTRFKNGEQVCWGSHDVLQGSPLTVSDVEELAAIAASASLMEQGELLAAIRTAREELAAAEAAPCTCSGFVRQYEGCLCARDKRLTAARAALEAAIARC